jgi:hypothetical protein
MELKFQSDLHLKKRENGNQINILSEISSNLLRRIEISIRFIKRDRWQSVEISNVRTDGLRPSVQEDSKA